MARRGAGKTLAVPINIQIAGTLFPNLPQLGSKEIQDNRAVGDSRPKGSLLSPVEHSPIDQVDNPVPYAVAGRDNAPLGAYKFLNIRNLPANLLQADSKQIQGYRVVADVLLNHLLSVEL